MAVSTIPQRLVPINEWYLAGGREQRSIEKRKKRKESEFETLVERIIIFFLLRKNVHLFSLSNLRIIITFTRSTILTIVINTNRFKKYRLERRLYYNDKRVFMNFSGSRSAEIYYPNGSLAIKFSGPPERDCNYQNLPYYTRLRQIDNLVEGWTKTRVHFLENSFEKFPFRWTFSWDDRSCQRAAKKKERERERKIDKCELFFFFRQPWSTRGTEEGEKRNDRKNRFQDDMYTVFSPGGKDFMGVKRRPQIIAVFDTMGNGAVFDEEGGTRSVWKESIPSPAIFNRLTVPSLRHFSIP